MTAIETMVIDHGRSTFLVGGARAVAPEEDFADLAKEAKTSESPWDITKANPYLKWISGDFAEADNPNTNKQFWTAGDLELAEYTIRFAPLNMVHKFKNPIGFFAATKTVQLARDTAADSTDHGSMKIQALSGLWSHLFPMEAAQVDAASEAGLLFYSMECRGSHLICGSNEAKNLEGCGNKYEYAAVDTHCEHLKARSSVRHIVNPIFRGGACIIPPVRPGWKDAHASVLDSAVKQEAAQYAEKHEAAFEVANADGQLTTSAWEQLMALVIRSARV